MNLSSNDTTVAGGTDIENLATGGATFSIAAGKGRKFILALHAPSANKITMIPTSDSFNLNS